METSLLHSKNRLSTKMVSNLIRVRELHELYSRCVADLEEHRQNPISSFDLPKWSNLNDRLLNELKKEVEHLNALLCEVKI
jgi:hypothetical protein